MIREKVPGMEKRFLLMLFSIVFLYPIYSQPEEPSGSGTGFFISDDGLIITCAHVIDDSARIAVKTGAGEYQAEILKKDTDADLAVLKINYRNAYHFKVANFDTVNLGDKLLVLGFPLSSILGADIRLTDGIVSSKGGIVTIPTYFQHSAPIQPGNSGGPIINFNFSIIGVAAASLDDRIMLESFGSLPQNVNFGVKSDYIRQITQNMRLGNGNVKSLNDAENATVQVLCYESPVNITENNSPNDKPSVKILNNTGYAVYYIYISSTAADEDEWEEDILGDDVLLDGGSVSVRLAYPLNTANRYDIKLEDGQGDTYTKRGVLITPGKTIEFTFDDIDW
jgi:S1-C subfamily serine protease